MSDWISQTLYSNGTMKNKLHIHDQKELEKKEYLITSRNASLFLMKKPHIDDISDLQKIHKIMFGELYDWAGEYRPGNFQKNGFDFFDHTRFGFAERSINNLIKNNPRKSALAPMDYAKLIDEINFMHPFREGNGRSCKVFMLAYAANHHQVLDYPRKNNEMIAAQQEADVDRIAKLIKVEDTPDRAAAFKQLLLKQRQELSDLDQDGLER